MSTKLFVGNLPIAATEDYLREFFEESGYVVTEVRIMLGRETGRSRGFAFVTFADGTDLRKVIDEANGQSFMGHTLTVNEATPIEPRVDPLQKNLSKHAGPSDALPEGASTLVPCAHDLQSYWQGGVPPPLSKYTKTVER